MALNIFGQDIKPCSTDPLTGFFRDGCCNTGGDDVGMHIVCVEVTEKFLEFSKSQGNDLISAVPPHFPGLKPGDRWCVCASRWLEAHEAGMAPPVILESSHMQALEWIDFSLLEEYALD